MKYSLRNLTRGTLLGDSIDLADSAQKRTTGLLRHKVLRAGEGLWIVPCESVHTFFMKFPIDAIFLDGGLRVRRVIENMRPWRLSPWVPAAHSILELKGGSLQGSVRAGDALEMRPA